eukprot:3981094-Pleurochrysis_carterae.AAC.1
MHTQIGDEGQQTAHILVIIDTGMRTVPDSADQQVRPVPRYPGGVEHADRAYFSWEPAAAFVRELDNTKHCLPATGRDTSGHGRGELAVFPEE